MKLLPLETFPALRELEGITHGLTLRRPGVDVRTDRETALERLQSHFAECIGSLGFTTADLATGEQVHGCDIAAVEAGTAGAVSGVDGLITNRPGVLLGSCVADCCAVYLVDRRTGAIGLVHSGKKGTELGIVPRAIGMMAEEYGVRARDLRVQLSPCIRPPHYEIDFAAEIRRQCGACGVPEGEVFDGGVSTATDLERYYSYRMEKGETGRMLALLGRREAE